MIQSVREIVFDTETTGFDPATGDKLVEIGAVELINHVPTGGHIISILIRRGKFRKKLLKFMV